MEDAPIVADGNISKGDISEKKVADGNTSKHDIRLVARMQSPFSMHGDFGGMSETSSLGESEL